MKPNNGKKTKLILTILICALITVGVTVGIGCYNYYGYDKYKTDFLDEFFARFIYVKSGQNRTCSKMGL